MTIETAIVETILRKAGQDAAVMRNLTSAFSRFTEVDRRLAGTEFRGRVSDVDAAKHMARVVIGETPEGEPVKSPWLPVAQVAGALKIHSLPSVGQQVRITTAAGDIEMGSVEPLHWSDGYDSPSDDGSEHVLTFGEVKIIIQEGRVEVHAPLVKVLADVKINGRLHVVNGIFSEDGVVSEVGVWPPSPTFVPPVIG